MVLNVRFRYLILLVTSLVLFALLRPHGYLPPAAREYLPSRLRPSSTHLPAEGLTAIQLDASAEAAVTKQSLWNAVHRVFLDHEPRHFENVAWMEEWPTMPGYQMNKTFDKDEILRQSPRLSNDDIEAATRMQASLEKLMPKWSTYSGLFSGRGYVMTTGSMFLSRVFPIGIQMLHRLDSTLPIEIWTKDQAEFELTDPIVRDLGKSFGLAITCHRFSDYVDISQFPEGYTSNYLMKALTMLLSSFEQVIMLDADNVPMMNPQPLLSSHLYEDTGLLLWPDFWSNSLSATLHTALKIPYTFTRTCESGQVVLDKRRHFESLVLANYYNWYGDRYYYKLITLDGMGTGDKDTFVVGAQSLGRPFHLTSRPVELLRAAHLDGRGWRDDTSVFNGAMGQFNPLNMSEVMFMHMHSPKLNFQLQEDVTADLVFVRADAEDVHFSPSRDGLERMLWESIVWLECESVLAVERDPRQVCDAVKKRLVSMAPG